MGRLFTILFLVTTSTSFAQQKISRYDIYNKGVQSYLTFLKDVGKIEFDTLYIEANDSLAYHLAPRLGSTNIKVLTWSDLANKINERPSIFYIKLVPIVEAKKKLIIGVFRHYTATEGEWGECPNKKIVYTESSSQRLTFSTNKRKSNYRLQPIETVHEYCYTTFCLDKETKKLIQLFKTCI